MLNKTEFKVKLKPIFNIKPEIYILVLYSIFLITIMFFLFVFPGIKKNGVEISLITTPSNASIYVDSIRIGSSPISFFIPKGEHKITVKKDNFSKLDEDIEIRGKVLFSLFSPSKKTLRYRLDSNNDDLLSKSFKEAAKWSLLKSEEVNNRYRLPNIISSPLIDYYSVENFNLDDLYSYLYSSTKIITNKFILGDYLRALSIVSSNNKLLSISSIIKSSIYLEDLIEKNPHLPLLIYNKIVPSTIRSENSNYYDGLTELHKIKINKNIISFNEPKKDINFNKFVFKNIPKSIVPSHDVNFIHNIVNEEFYILEELLSKESYFKFLELNDKWSVKNRENLINEGLVDKYYLDFTNDEKYITNISYYGAEAWCNWANSYYNVPKGYKFALPTENMWFSAELFGTIENNDAWQWTSQGFFLYDHFLTSEDGEVIKAYAEIEPRVVVGRNKYNIKAESSRGVQDAQWCTPYLSFRPVLIKD